MRAQGRRGTAPCISPARTAMASTHRIARALGLARSLGLYYGNPLRPGRLTRLYSPFLGPGALGFDIGVRALSFGRPGTGPWPAWTGWRPWGTAATTGPQARATASAQPGGWTPPGSAPTSPGSPMGLGTSTPGAPMPPGPPESRARSNTQGLFPGSRGGVRVCLWWLCAGALVHPTTPTLARARARISSG
jgi:hypothetical protein